MKSLAVVITSDFLQNNAGGGQVFKSNLKALEAIHGDLKIYSINFSKRKVESYHYEKGILVQTKNFIDLNWLNIKYSILIMKAICFIKLSFRYDLLWVEHYYSLPSFKVTPNYIFKKIIYSQHDFLFKIKALKNKVSKNNELYLEETKTISKCKLVISGNMLEVIYAKETLAVNSYYLPISINNISITEFDTSKEVVHLGSFNTTASKQGFKHYKNNIQQNVLDDVKVILIGQGTEGYQDDNIKGCGFVNNLSDYLKTGTISIIPWKHDTGQRTRVFESLSYGCVIVSYKVLGEIIPELLHNLNCVLVESDKEFAQAINDLMNNKDKRNKLAQEALKTAKIFNFDTRVDTLKKILEM